MKRGFIFVLSLMALVSCDKGGDRNIINVEPTVENFDGFVGESQYVYGYENDAIKCEYFFNEEYGYWGGFAHCNVFETDAKKGLYENQYAAYNSQAASGDGFLLYYYDSYNEPCDILFKSEESVVRLSSVKLNLTTYTYASITDEDINAFARAFDEDDYLKVVFYGVDAFGRTVGEGAECYVVDYRDGKRFVADNWQEFYLPGILSNRVRVTIETSDVGEWGANTPLYICMDDLTYTTI
ncbi:MAG: DUF4465 domain-containing protein [Alistipes sp.]|nr:DUF4465 domain-containing protein [Alistipes sp.]